MAKLKMDTITKTYSPARQLWTHPNPPISSKVTSRTSYVYNVSYPHVLKQVATLNKATSIYRLSGVHVKKSGRASFCKQNNAV